MLICVDKRFLFSEPFSFTKMRTSVQGKKSQRLFKVGFLLYKLMNSVWSRFALTITTSCFSKSPALGVCFHGVLSGFTLWVTSCSVPQWDNVTLLLIKSEQ